MVYGVENAVNVHTRMNKGFLTNLDREAATLRVSRAQVLDRILTGYFTTTQVATATTTRRKTTTRTGKPGRPVGAKNKTRTKTK